MQQKRLHTGLVLTMRNGKGGRDNMNNFTEGPWRINDMTLPSRKFINIGHDIAPVPVKNEGKYYAISQVDGETRANAHLIAAAPELLEALKDCQQVLFEYVFNDEVPEMCNFAEAETGALEAIRNATRE